jgi:hypothetical protein
MFERVTVLSSPSNVRTRQHKKPDTTVAYFSVVPHLGTGVLPFFSPKFVAHSGG